jgi:hypothetical protein
MFIMFCFILFIICAVFSIGGALLYLFYLPFKIQLLKTGKLSKSMSKYINKWYIFILLSIAFYVTYDSFYPGESFYADEFKEVTLRDLPDSAEFIFKLSTYPDFHGDYSSESTIKLSRPDFKKLLHALNKDERITKPGQNKFPDDSSFITSYSVKNDTRYWFFRQIENESDHHLRIEFSRDGQTIYVTVGVT